MRNTSGYMFVAGMAVACFSCTPTKIAYQKSYDGVLACPPGEFGRKVKPTGTKHVAVVEFTDQGQLHAPDQLDQALRMVKEAGKKPLIITFVHGWRHDARPGDNDLFHFRRFIEDAANEENKRRHGYDVRGVYIGWRGAAVEEPVPVLSAIPAFFTFWNRKDATDRVACEPLRDALKKFYDNVPRDTGGRIVLMGHSFGGRILDLTTGKGIIENKKDIVVGYKPIADLVVLINPASESLQARNVKLASAGWEKDYPLIVAIGAKNDGPNKIAWPLGYWLWLRNKSVPLEGSDEWSSDYLDKTVANDPKQFTHTLDREGPRPTLWERIVRRLSFYKPRTLSAPPPPETVSVAESLSGLVEKKEEPFSLPTGPEDTEERWKLNHIDQEDRKDVKHALDSKAYWVFQVDEEILSKHSGDRKGEGVFNKPMAHLLYKIFAKTQVGARSPEKVLVETTQSDMQKILVVPDAAAAAPTSP